MNAFKIALYLVAIVSSATCAILLLRAYVHRRVRLLMWSGICFVGLTINNVALFADLVVFPQTRLTPGATSPRTDRHDVSALRLHLRRRLGQNHD